MRAEPAIIRRAVYAGCVPLTPSQAEIRLRHLLADSVVRQDQRPSRVSGHPSRRTRA
jgi:hypothetical protein